MPGMNLHSVILSYAEKAKLSVILGAIESIGLSVGIKRKSKIMMPRKK